VSDVAIMFGALESATPDPNDPATRRCTPAPGRDYAKFLNRDGLKGARIGIPRAFFYDRITPPGDPSALREPQGRPEPGRGTTGSGQAATGSLSWRMVEYLIKNGRIGCVPGVDFGANGEGYVRFCFARDRKELIGALQSMKQLFGVTV
jgi:hypothetical protein